MFSEIYEAVRSTFNPIRSIVSSTYMTLPDLTTQLTAMLQLYYRYNPYEDFRRYKRVMKTKLHNPNRQSIMIVFDYDGLEEKNDYNVESNIIMGKFIYEGKLTAITIVPLSIQQDLDRDGGEYIAINMYRIINHIMATDNYCYTSNNPYSDYTFVPVSTIKLHSMDVIFIKWVMDVFLGVTMTKDEISNLILKILKEIRYSSYEMKHVKTYIDLLFTTSLENILDYSFIASESDMILDIRGMYISDEKDSNDTDSKEVNNNEETVSQD